MNSDRPLVACIFDMDGVLIDSEPIVKQCGQQAASELGAVLTDELFNDLIGLPSHEVQSGLRNAFGENFPMDTFRTLLEQRWHEFVKENGIPVKPGVIQLLDYFESANIPFAIATSTPHERARLALTVAGLIDRFDEIVGGDQVTNGKPAGDIFEAAASRISSTPHSCLAIEDSKVGAHAAVAASMYTMMVPDQKPPDEETRAIVQAVYPSLVDAFDPITELMI